jgi:hypothetical protein
MSISPNQLPRSLLRLLAVAIGIVVVIEMLGHDQSLAGYGPSNYHTDGDPLALAVGALVTFLLWRIGDYFTR